MITKLAHPTVKMQCPLCKSTIMTIVNKQSAIVKYYVWPSVKTNRYNYGDPKDLEFLENPGINEWSCPKCGEVLFKTAEEVVAFVEKWKKFNKRGSTL